MENVQETVVLVNAKSLDDVLELGRLAAERFPHDDVLASALRGAIAQVRADLILEP